MDHVRIEERPELVRPAMVCAFRGWNDGGEASTSAATYLRDRWQARRFASVDPEEFFDFQVARPTVQLVDGVTRQIEWPRNEFFHASPGGRDVMVLLGIEPNMRWRTFIEAILGLAKDLGVESLVTLGAFLADVPHTLATPLAGSAASQEEAASLGMSASRYEGPTGIVGLLHDAALRAGMHSLSLWAAVPHYLPGGPNPKAALALAEKAAAVLGAPIETDTLARAGANWERQVSESIAENPELSAYVKRLEEVAGEREITEIPSGETLAAELERFLRDQRGDQG
jgi:proteasome assembly chaperone (PAC2) family protein